MFTIKKLKQDIEESISKIGISEVSLEIPPQGLGDFALPCFPLAKTLKKSPNDIASDIAQKLEKTQYVKDIQTKGPYVNFFVDWSAVFGEVLNEISEGYRGLIANGHALIEHTSVNPNASPHVGRSRNAIIGDTISRILKYSGIETSVHYFVNDVGKQIALLVYACKQKGIDKIGFADLLSIYVAASKELEEDNNLENEVFSLLKKFESGDKQTVNDFNSVVRVCIDGQTEIFSKINSKYDVFDFESKYIQSGRINDILGDLEKTGKLFTDEQNRKVMKLESKTPEGQYLVLVRSDGTSLYPLRDIAYTVDKCKATKDQNIIILGEDQKMYFSQISQVVTLLGYTPPVAIHYSFVLLPSGKMSTRKGTVVLLDDFLNEAQERALKEVESRYPDLDKAEKNSRSKMIAAAAVRYAIVKVSPEKNVTFNLDDAIKMEGDTGPYLQYTHARANSIIKKSKIVKSCDTSKLTEEKEILLMKTLSQFPLIVESAASDMKPHYIANYVYEVCEAFNSFYQSVRVLQAQEEKDSRLALVNATKNTIKDCLDMLGIDTMDEM